MLRLGPNRASMTSPQCRHCYPIALNPTASSVLLLGARDLKAAVEEVETEIVPSVTALCPKCKRISILAPELDVAHPLWLLRRLRPFLDKMRHETRGAAGDA